MCRSNTTWDAKLFNRDIEEEQKKQCSKCLIFEMAELLEVYGKTLTRYEMRYMDDGR